jgi:hypothetical protein
MRRLHATFALQSTRASLELGFVGPSTSRVDIWHWDGGVVLRPVVCVRVQQRVPSPLHVRERRQCAGARAMLGGQTLQRGRGAQCEDDAFQPSSFHPWWPQVSRFIADWRPDVVLLQDVLRGMSEAVVVWVLKLLHRESAAGS